MHIDLSTTPNSELMTVELDLPPHLLEEARSPSNERDMHLLLTKRNRVAIQQPIVRELTDTIETDIIEALERRWESSPVFFVVSTTMGCLPDPDCRFTWMRINFSLNIDPMAQDFLPVVCKMYPENSEDEVKEIKSFEINSNLGLTLDKIETPGISHTRKSSQEHPTYYYRVTTFGKMSSKPVWDFRTTDVHPEIAGDFTLLFIVALKPGLETSGEVSISAEVQLRSRLPKFPVLMRRSKDNAVSNRFTLSKGTTT